MLSKEDNELLCRVAPGAPMGRLLRCFWPPFALAGELAEPDCPSLRGRLLGEDLVAFRDTDGRVGRLAANCSHRGASLLFGRNEEAVAYPCQDRGGVRIQFCNFLRNVEGEVDSSHVSFLHSRNTRAASADSLAYDATGDKSPRFYVLPTPYGLLIGARCDAVRGSTDHDHVRHGRRATRTPVRAHRTEKRVV